MKHTISVLVDNKPGVLARISGLFSARGFNITSLAVGETNDPTVSRMTIIVSAEDRILEQVQKQLHKLIDVISVSDLTKRDYFERELVLIKVNMARTTKQKLTKLLDKFSATILSSSKQGAVVEVVGDNKEISKVVKLLEAVGIKELVRTGRIAITS
ncbi:MAG: acetolactate synthase small subunit [PVC group bacterium]|nr:acetolactate synthase small subunit [PVC group bacterium]